MAVMGLALTGTTEAENALRNLEQRVETNIQVRFRREVQETLEMALDTNNLISRVGLLEYYRQTEEQWQKRQ
jgi:hypothetical protein